MALQDLTPQLRTRLSRVERWVGLFVTVATLLLLFGLGYYVYQVAQRKGWFLEKIPYHTYVQNAQGLKVGDPVKLMGFDVGQITEIEAMPPGEPFNIFLKFRVREPYYGYLWTDSHVKIGTSDLLGNRFIEVTKGTTGAVTVVQQDGALQMLDHKVKTNTGHVPLGESLRYIPATNNAAGYWLTSIESPALSERLENVVSTVEHALPGFLNLTNQLRQTLSNAASVVTHTDELLVSARPIVTNLSRITANLSGPKGSLGEWLIPTNINQQLDSTLASAAGVLGAAETNVTMLSSNLALSLQNLAGITSNLHAQVEANSLILSEISSLVVNSDELVRGLQRHWLLKGAFADDSTNAPLQNILKPRIGEIK